MNTIDERHIEALRVFTSHQVQFIVIGGVGLQAHGHTASTKDVDLTVAVDAGNVQRINAALAELGAHTAMPGKRGTSYGTRMGRVELLNDTDGVGPFEAWQPQARTMEIAAGVNVLVGSPSDIVLSKEAADRPKDREALPRIRQQLLELGALQPHEIRGPVSDERVAAAGDGREQYARAVLGDRPEQAHSAALWDHGASRISAYRERWQITTGPDQPLGPTPGADQSDQAQDLDALQRSLTRTVRMIGRAREHEDPSVELGR